MVRLILDIRCNLYNAVILNENIGYIGFRTCSVIDSGVLKQLSHINPP